MTEIIEQNFNDENEFFWGEINRKNDINDVRKSSKTEIVIENNLNEQDITELLAEVIAERIAKNTPLPPFVPLPRFMIASEYSINAKLLYGLLLNHTLLSQKSGWYRKRTMCMSFTR